MEGVWYPAARSAAPFTASSASVRRFEKLTPANSTVAARVRISLHKEAARAARNVVTGPWVAWKGAVPQGRGMKKMARVAAIINPTSASLRTRLIERSIRVAHHHRDRISPAKQLRR